MADATLCNVCNTPSRIEDAVEIGLIPSNVRRFQAEKFTVWRCRSCQSLHSKETIDLAYYYKHYPVQQHRLDLWARVAYSVRLKRLIREGLRRELSLLDYGCGNGLFVSYLQERGYRNAAGFDPYIPEYANENTLSKTYDFVAAQDVIEHAETPKKLMERLTSYVRPSGMLCIGTPNAVHINLSQPDRFALSLHQPYHRHILSEAALLQLGKEMGLKPKRIYHRWYYDSLFPTINYRFLQTYVLRAGNMLDAAFEPPRIGMVMTSPLMLFYALFGYFFPPRTEMMILFHKP